MASPGGSGEFVSVFLLLHNRSEEACYSPTGSIEEVCAFHPPTGSREENSQKNHSNFHLKRSLPFI